MQAGLLHYQYYQNNYYFRCFHVLARPTCKVWNRLSHIFMCVRKPNMYISKEYPEYVVCNQIYIV